MWYLEDGLVGGWSRQWWLGVKSPPPNLQGSWGRCRVQDLLGELWDGIKSAAVHLAGAVPLAQRRIPSAVVPADREVSAPKCVPPISPHVE